MTKGQTLAELRALHAQEERLLVRRALVRSDWALTGAAAALGVPVTTLADLVRRHGLDAERDKRRPAGCPEVNRRGGRAAKSN